MKSFVMSNSGMCHVGSHPLYCYVGGFIRNDTEVTMSLNIFTYTLHVEICIYTD